MKDYMLTNNYFADIENITSISENSDDGDLDSEHPSFDTIPTTPETAILGAAIDITKETMRCLTEYAKCKEHEETERKRIVATLRAIQYQIDAQKEIYLKHLDDQHQDRQRLYAMAERSQEKALELGDKEMLALCYNLVLNVYNKQNDLQDVIIKKLSNFNETTF